MGTNSSKNKRQEVVLLHRTNDSKSTRSATISFSTASLSCLAAEYHQIHDQETLDTWRTKAIQTIDDLCGQKASYLRQEAHLNVLLDQLRAIINEERSSYGGSYFLDEKTCDNSKI